ncbi:ABC transporter ATP-binding protein/permease [Streptomyces sp. RS10V-4]|uniref:ABC transporter transmembrane domain-containing protein n=1 Tax=Streptomyces rhizoryzae TaxID=2932493 RepID=UPI0020058E62|nr:ABC transporter ATP-binding protein [Streptomyces rhizoryzae]MCK7625715.1 ABC transporter ATP-binding protein/permease [Streptomyces rhizoryzae]
MRIRDLPHPDPGVPDVRTGGRFLVWLCRQQRGGQAKALGWGLLHTGATAAFPLPVGLAVQAAVDGRPSRLLLAGGLLALLGALVALGDVMLHRAAVTNWIVAVARMQQLLARKTADLGGALTRRVAAGEVVAVSTGDLERIGWFVETLSRSGAALAAAGAVCLALIGYEPHLGLLVVLGLPVLALAAVPLLPAATRRADEQRDKAGRATELASDTVAGLRVLRGIGGEELFLRRYRSASQEVRRAAVRSARMWSLISAVQVALPGLLLIAVVWYGVRLTADHRITVGELVTIYGAVAFLLYPLRQIEEITMAWSFARPSATRTARVLALTRPAGGRLAPPEPPSGDLHDPVSGLTARAGRLTAVVCGDPDAAGRLAERLGGHPPHTGGDGDGCGDRGGDRAADGPESGRPLSVELGGTPLDDLPRETARAAVLVQDKDPVLLSGTVGALLDVPASGRVAAAEALAAAQCGDVLAALARATAADCGDPMRAHLTERGRSLSGGQRQRLALARSLVADPGVLVLDEPTSAVDAHTEARIADGLRTLRSGRTTVVLTSSPLLLDRADEVVFLQDGKVAGAAPHRELLRTHPEYRAVVTRRPDPEPGTREANTPEAGTPRAGTPGEGTPEACTSEAGTARTGTPEARPPEGGTPQAPTPEPGPPAPGAPESAPPEAGAGHTVKETA